MRKGTIVCSIGFSSWLVGNNTLIFVFDLEVTPSAKCVITHVNILPMLILLVIQRVFYSSSAAHYS